MHNGAQICVTSVYKPKNKIMLLSELDFDILIE